jgi:hypothetical protein
MSNKSRVPFLITLHKLGIVDILNIDTKLLTFEEKGEVIMSKMLGTMDKMLNRIDEHKKGLIK